MKIRKDFPIFKNNIVYLDSAATTHKPTAVLKAMNRFYGHNYGTVHRAIYALAKEATEAYCAVRTQVQRFLGASSPDEIIFTKGTTEAINLVAYSFGEAFIHAGDEIITTETEHHANLVPWQRLCKAKGAHLKIIPVNDKGELILESYEKLLSPRTKLVTLAHISNATGTHHPLERIIPLAHQKGAKVFVDGAQSAGHMPIDLKLLDADFFAFSGHKAFGPTGVGVLYGKQELLKKMPPYQMGGDMIQEVTLHEATFQEPPLRFEAGTPMIAEVIGLGAALAYIESVGIEQIMQWELGLLQTLTEKLLEIPKVRLIGTAGRKGPIQSFCIEGIHPLDAGVLLDTHSIAVRTGHLCTQPTMRRFGISSAIRVSFGAYNTYRDIDRFIHHLKQVIKILS